MPIIDIQRRLREVGRIRLGEQVVTPQGKTRPVKLEKFRLTSRDREVIEAAAAAWGGEAKPWDAPDGQQWEVYTDVDSIPVVVPPTEMAFSQWYEQWSAGGCQARCDGQWDHQRDQKCACDPEDRECSMTTRLSVILDDIPGLGVWRVETHGYYAAVELGGAVDVCRMYAGAGRMLPARLRLEQRKTTKTLRSGKVETYRYAVPVLDVDVQMSHLMAIAAGTPGALPAGTPVAIGAPTPGALPAAGFTPTGEGAPPATVADQLDAIDNPAARAPRANASAPLPATGAAPRTEAAAPAPPPPPAPPAGGPPVAGVPNCATCGQTLAGAAVSLVEGNKVHKGGCPAPPVLDAATDEAAVAAQPAAAPAPDPDQPPPPVDPRDDHDRQRRRFHAIAQKRWPGDAGEREKARHAWLETQYDVKSLNDLDAQGLARAADGLQQEVEALEVAAEGEPFPDAIDTTATEPEPEPAPEPDPPPEPEPAPPTTPTAPAPAATPSAAPVQGEPDADDHVAWTEDQWRDYLAASGIKVTAFMKEALDLAPQVGEGEVGGLGDIVGKPSLTGLMRSWVMEQVGEE